MYGAGIVFLLYSYVSKGPPAGWLNRLTKFVQKRRLIGGFASDLVGQNCDRIQFNLTVQDQNLPKIGRNVEGAGSLYLRLGTLCIFDQLRHLLTDSLGQVSAAVALCCSVWRSSFAFRIGTASPTSWSTGFLPASSPSSKCTSSFAIQKYGP